MERLRAMEKHEEQSNKSSVWLFVVHNARHMLKVETMDQTNWCVSRKAKEGDRAFLYQSLKGIICFFEIIEKTESESFCNSYGILFI